MNISIPALLVTGLLAAPLGAQAAINFSVDSSTALVGTFAVTGTTVEAATPAAFDFGLSYCAPMRVSRDSSAAAGLQCAGSPADPRALLADVMAGPRTSAPVAGTTSLLAGSPVTTFYFRFWDLQDTGGAGGTFSGSFCFSRDPAGCGPIDPEPVAASLRGFFAPVDAPSVATNDAKAGRTVPLRFHASTSAGPITDLTTASLSIVGVACADVAVAADRVDEYEADASVALANLGGGDYQFNWKTPKSIAGTCKTVTLSLPAPYSTPTHPTATFRFGR